MRMSQLKFCGFLGKVENLQKLIFKNILVSSFLDKILGVHNVGIF